MYITSVMDYLGAWQKLNRENGTLIQDIEKSLAQVTKRDLVGQQRRRREYIDRREEIDIGNVSRKITRNLADLGWEREVRLLPGKRRTSNHISLDAIKDSVGLEVVMGRRAFAESLLFMRIPLFVRTNKIEKAILLLPTDELAHSIYPSVGSYFEAIYDVLDNTPLTLKYPFCILGFSLNQAPLNFTSLTTDIDEFLISSIGRPLEEMLALHEREEYDFKVKVDKPEKLRDTLCAFSNLISGGLLVIGVADNGHIVGIEKGKECDETKLRLIDSTNGKFDPKLHITIHEFDMPGNPSRQLIFLRVYPVAIKPCTLDGRVHIRLGSSTQIATPQDIRKLVIGQ